MENYLTVKEVAKKLHVSKTTIYKFLSEGRFPKPVPLGTNIKRWPESVLDKWLKDKEEGHTTKESK